MNLPLPLMSPEALDNAVFELVSRELGVANAMRFIARHHQPDGIDYTRDRHKWLPQDGAEIDRMFAETRSDPDYIKLVEASKRNARKRKSKARAKN